MSDMEEFSHISASISTRLADLAASAFAAAAVDAGADADSSDRLKRSSDFMRLKAYMRS